MHFKTLILALIGFAYSGVSLPAAIPQAWLNVQITRWNKAEVSPQHRSKVRIAANRYHVHRARYESVARASGVPAYVIFGLHNMESSGSFRHHLHEGSPLIGRTRWVPKGRPKEGKPPFTWEYSVLDALAYDNLRSVNWTRLDHILYACERYNGTGYLRFHPETPTQYLWAATTVEKPGKYIADGKWSSTARSSQIGIVALWKVLGLPTLK